LIDIEGDLEYLKNKLFSTTADNDPMLQQL